MKKIFSLSVILLAVLLLLPLYALTNEQITESATPESAQTMADAQISGDDFKVLITETNKIETLSAEDYIFGVVAGEMPALYEEEALKAQAVCAYTFALWRKRENSDKDYDISDDYTTDQCYISPEDARKKWGSNAETHEQKIRNAIKAVLLQKLTYNGDIILSVYHSLSSGKTESAKNVWGKEYPYLQAVSSVGDKLAANYISTAQFTTEQLETALKITIPKDTKNVFSDIKRTESGTVKNITVCDQKMKGSEVRSALQLKSSNFEITQKDGVFTFTVYGYGHGVGLSQNGANYMAKQGSDYKEILTHYYTGCEIMRNS